MALRELLLVRHGESAGNVAREEAEAIGADVIDVEWRDADAPLTKHGCAQAAALGGWLGEHVSRIDAVWSSPYLRAHDTVRRALEAAGLEQAIGVDERLRDRELGILDRLTSAGVRRRHPEEAARRRVLGKLYYRPPGGESWADVALRLRSFLRDVNDGPAETVLVSCHDATILLFRYVLEGFDEPTVLDLAATSSVGNASLTRLRRVDPGSAWELVDFGSVAYLEQAGVAPTQHGADDDAHPR